MTGFVAHLDCDAFYVNAERVRHPDLAGKPVGVLGNNGACVIAKSYEMKAKGVKTGTPIWDAKALCPDGVYVKRDFYWYEVLELWAGTFEIDPTATPKVWDHRSHDARKEGEDVLGIYDLDGDTLKVACVVGRWKGKEWVGRSRPRGFDPKEADVVIELKRAK